MMSSSKPKYQASVLFVYFNHHCLLVCSLVCQSKVKYENLLHVFLLLSSCSQKKTTTVAAKQHKGNIISALCVMFLLQRSH